MEDRWNINNNLHRHIIHEQMVHWPLDVFKIQTCFIFAIIDMKNCHPPLISCMRTWGFMYREHIQLLLVFLLQLSSHYWKVIIKYDFIIHVLWLSRTVYNVFRIETCIIFLIFQFKNGYNRYPSSKSPIHIQAWKVTIIQKYYSYLKKIILFRGNRNPNGALYLGFVTLKIGKATSRTPFIYGDLQVA